MNTDLTNLIIGIVSAILGVVLTVYKDDIANIFLSSKKYRFLKGKWGCRWNENATQTNPAKSIYDQVEIKQIVGRRVKGTGFTEDYGDWEFTGTISDSALTLVYKNEIGSDRSGVVILKLDADKLKLLEGVWCQHKRGDLIIGTTEWRKP
jgi:hypothetical protein